MLKNIRVLLLLILGISVSEMEAQDFHFTQYHFSPMTVNPAYTGNFYGTLRFNGIVRDQYRGIGKPFNSLAASAEYNLPFGFRKNDWISAGVMISRDKSGSIGQSMSLYGGNLAYHFSLDKKQNRIFTIGAQYGGGDLSYDRLSAEDTSIGLIGQASENLTSFNGKLDENGNVKGGSLSDLAVGGLFTNYAKMSTLKLGVAIEGLLRGDRSLSQRKTDRKQIGFNLSGEYDQKLNKLTSITSGAWIYVLGPAFAANVNSRINYIVSPKKKIKISGGLGTRTFNSIFFTAGMQFSDLKVGLAYDADISGLRRAGGPYKALELGASYIYKLYKKPDPKPIIYCPRL